MTELASLDHESVSLRGLYRLAGAVLVQAIVDIRCGSGRKKAEALRWIEDASERQFSFSYCCKMVSRDPDHVRRQLARQQIPQWLISSPNVEAVTTH